MPKNQKKNCLATCPGFRSLRVSFQRCEVISSHTATLPFLAILSHFWQASVCQSLKAHSLEGLIFFLIRPKHKSEQGTWHFFSSLQHFSAFRGLVITWMPLNKPQSKYRASTEQAQSNRMAPTCKGNYFKIIKFRSLGESFCKQADLIWFE